MNLQKKHINLLYQCVVNEMGKCKGRPAVYKTDLIELEKILHKEYEIQRNY